MGDDMSLWSRIRLSVRSAQAAILTEPIHLAPLIPMIEEAVSIVDKKPSKKSVEELDYLLTKIQTFVVKWRPSPRPTPGVFYIQPGWAKSTDDQASEALSLLKDLRVDAVDAGEDQNEAG
jgi:hypothetical protein